MPFLFLRLLLRIFGDRAQRVGKGHGATWCSMLPDADWDAFPREQAAVAAAALPATMARPADAAAAGEGDEILTGP